jgi:membrane associated rhomboid family serine protease
MILVPIADRGVPWKSTPWLWALIGVNVLVMAVALLSRDLDALVLGGALDPRHLRPLTFVSSMFLHASIGHLVGNMLFLWGVGQAIHRRLGGRLFLAAYLIAGLAAGFSYAIFTPALPAVGASGAVSGLMGLFLALWPGRRMRIAYWIGKGGLFRPRAYWALGLWIALQIWFARSDDGTDHVAYAAHIGGFGAGAAIGLLLRLRVAPGPVREWMLEAPEPDEETHAHDLARAVVHNLQLGATEPMARAWDDWESGRAHVGFSEAELGRVQGDFQRRGDAARASKAATWKRLIS